MFSSLKKIFHNSNNELDSSKESENLELFCGLMIEAAQSDGKVDSDEINKISIILNETFNENESEVNKAISKCLKELNEPKSLHFFTSKINKSFSNDKKLKLIQTLWEIVLSDGKIHEYESNLIRRLAGLLYISDVASGNAKKTVLEKINKLQK